jgi:hypothetical protein
MKAAMAKWENSAADKKADMAGAKKMMASGGVLNAPINRRAKGAEASGSAMTKSLQKLDAGVSRMTNPTTAKNQKPSSVNAMAMHPKGGGGTAKFAEGGAVGGPLGSAMTRMERDRASPGEMRLFAKKAMELMAPSSTKTPSSMGGMAKSPKTDGGMKNFAEGGSVNGSLNPASPPKTSTKMFKRGGKAC